jgi:pimeloyl-ACP methyl ester carboxylesterase
LDVEIDYQPRLRRVGLATAHGEGQMAFLDYGPPSRTPDVVFLHANGFNARTYRTILGPLADDLRILAPDQRGHGATTLPTNLPRTSWLDLKADLLAFLDALGLDRVALCGHSMGGTAALLAAGQALERVKALALLDPVIRPPGPAPDPEAAGASPMAMGASRRRSRFPDRATAVASYRGRGAFRTWTDAMLEDYVEAGFLDQPDGTVSLACAPAWEVSNYIHHDHDSWAAFDAARCPVRILRAEIESTARIDGDMDRLMASGRVRVDTIPETTHFLPMERPHLVREAIREAVAAP